MMKQSQRGSQFGWLPKFQRTSQDVFCPHTPLLLISESSPWRGRPVGGWWPVLAVWEVIMLLASGVREEDGRPVVFLLLLCFSLCVVPFAFPPPLFPLPCQQPQTSEGRSCQAPHTWAPWLSQQPQDQRQSCALWEGERRPSPRPLLLIYDWLTTLYMFKVYNRKIWYLYILWYCITIRWYLSPHIGSPSNHSSHLWGEPVRCTLLATLKYAIECITLNVTSPGLMYLYNWRFVPLGHLHLCLPHLRQLQIWSHFHVSDFFKIPHTNGIVLHLSFFVWLTSLS